MTKKEKLLNINHNKFKKIVSSCSTKTELHKKLDVPLNGTYRKIVNKLIKDTGAKLKPKKLKYKVIKKTCPVCDTVFEHYENHPRPKITCSYSCSNKYFRSGINNGNFKGTQYRTICFSYHKKECVVCGENRIVEVHHYDENKNNNEPANLIPLCPTDHKLFHSKYRNDVSPIIEKYHKNFKKKFKM